MGRARAKMSAEHRPGDWPCLKCGNNNFSSRTEGNMCKAPKAPTPYSTSYEHNAPSCYPPEPVRREADRPGGRPGDWLCHGSGNDNFAFRDECNKCKARRAVIANPCMPLPGNGNNAPDPSFPEDWLCLKCSNNNFARRVACNRCQEPRPAEPPRMQPSQQFYPPQGYSQGTDQFRGMQTAPPAYGAPYGSFPPGYDGAPMYPAPRMYPPGMNYAPPYEPQGYVQPPFTQQYPPPQQYPHMYDPHSGRGGKGGSEQGQYHNDWLCKDCGNDNFAKRTRCNKCQAPRALDSVPTLAVPGNTWAPNVAVSIHPVSQYPNDWLCAECGNDNFAKRTSCNKCQTPRDPHANPTKATPGAGVNKEAYPMDWKCSACDNDNFARRTVCNRCQLPKVAVDAVPITPGASE